MRLATLGGRGLNLSADLAASPNNASECYSELATAARDDEERRGQLKQAVDGSKESVAKLRDYAAKAAELLGAFGEQTEAKQYAELARRLDEEVPAALRPSEEEGAT